MLTDTILTIPTNLCAHTVECLQDKFLEMELLGQRVFALTPVESPNCHPLDCTICYYLSALGFILPVFVEAVA